MPNNVSGEAPTSGAMPNPASSETFDEKSMVPNPSAVQHPNAKLCKKCSTVIPKEAKVCPQCGTKQGLTTGAKVAIALGILGVFAVCSMVSCVACVALLADDADQSTTSVVVEPAPAEVPEEAEVQEEIAEEAVQVTVQDIMLEAFGTFEPMVFSGSGDDIIRDLPGGFFAASAVHEGSRNFIVEGLDSNDERIELTFNDVGTYSGTALVGNRGDVVTLDVSADGAWEITVFPIADLPELELGKDYSGDQVLIWESSARDLNIVHSGRRNFIIESHTAERRSLLVNEIGDYDGTVIAPTGFVLLEISADGTWSISSAD